MVSMKLHHTYRHNIAHSSRENVTAIREARCRLKRDVETNHIDSPCIMIQGEMCIPAGPLPSFVDPMTLEAALLDLPEGARLASIKCVTAWRMGHVDAHSLHQYLLSVSWQSSALQQCAALAPACVSKGLSRESSAGEEGEAHSETPETDACELLSEEEMRSMMGGSFPVLDILELPR
jgi:hypothetical protein